VLLYESTPASTKTSSTTSQTVLLFAKLALSSASPLTGHGLPSNNNNNNFARHAGLNSGNRSKPLDSDSPVVDKFFQLSEALLDSSLPEAVPASTGRRWYEQLLLPPKDIEVPMSRVLSSPLPPVADTLLLKSQSDWCSTMSKAAQTAAFRALSGKLSAALHARAASINKHAPAGAILILPPSFSMGGKNGEIQIQAQPGTSPFFLDIFRDGVRDTGHKMLPISGTRQGLPIEDLSLLTDAPLIPVSATVDASATAGPGASASAAPASVASPAASASAGQASSSSSSSGSAAAATGSRFALLDSSSSSSSAAAAATAIREAAAPAATAAAKAAAKAAATAAAKAAASAKATAFALAATTAASAAVAAPEARTSVPAAAPSSLSLWSQTSNLLHRYERLSMYARAPPERVLHLLMEDIEEDKHARPAYKTLAYNISDIDVNLFDQRARKALASDMAACFLDMGFPVSTIVIAADQNIAHVTVLAGGLLGTSRRYAPKSVSSSSGGSSSGAGMRFALHSPAATKEMTTRAEETCRFAASKAHWLRDAVLEFRKGVVALEALSANVTASPAPDSNLERMHENLAELVNRTVEGTLVAVDALEGIAQAASQMANASAKQGRPSSLPAHKNIQHFLVDLRIERGIIDSAFAKSSTVSPSFAAGAALLVACLQRAEEKAADRVAAALGAAKTKFRQSAIEALAVQQLSPDFAVPLAEVLLAATSKHLDTRRPALLERTLNETDYAAEMSAHLATAQAKLKTFSVSHKKKNAKILKAGIRHESLLPAVQLIGCLLVPRILELYAGDAATVVKRLDNIEALAEEFCIPIALLQPPPAKRKRASGDADSDKAVADSADTAMAGTDDLVPDSEEDQASEEGQVSKKSNSSGAGSVAAAGTVPGTPPRSPIK
jgi:hypothetical protein